MDSITGTANVLADQALAVHDPEDPPGAVLLASTLLEELVRRLNHATTGPEAFETPGDIAAVVANLTSAATRAAQLLEQMAGHVERFMAHPALYSTTGRATEQAGSASIYLRNARVSVRDAAGRLEKAHNALATIGLSDAL